MYNTQHFLKANGKLAFNEDTGLDTATSMLAHGHTPQIKRNWGISILDLKDAAYLNCAFGFSHVYYVTR